MSKIGKRPITIENGVEVNVDGQTVHVKGSKGELSYTLPAQVTVQKDDQTLVVSRKDDSITARALHGTWRAHLQNAVTGVSQGYGKELELIGLGYRVELKGRTLVLQVGFSHPVKVKLPEGIEAKVEKTKIALDGIDKQQVGEIAARIRRIRPPEPYKGTGIKYADEIIRRKAGKAAKAASPSAGV